MKTITMLELSKAPGKWQYILIDPVTEVAVALVHEDHIIDTGDPYHRNLIDRLEAGETIKVALAEI
jgi:hypothetical protein